MDGSERETKDCLPLMVRLHVGLHLTRNRDRMQYNYNTCRPLRCDVTIELRVLLAIYRESPRGSLPCVIIGMGYIKLVLRGQPDYASTDGSLHKMACHDLEGSALPRW